MNDTWFTRRNGRSTEHNWPSNFWIEPDGTHVEAEYQAEKHAGHPWRQLTILRSTPGRAKRLGRRWPLTSYQMMEWNNRKTAVMRELLRRKIYDHTEIAVALCMTDDEILVEKNWWHDNEWGDCTCLQCYRIGENLLGKLWMELREEIR
jgi:type I restriction enzyme, S subunit